jgi:AcrR family transcriptional regulator
MGTRERRLREAGHRRKQILDAARRLFWQHGYAGTSIPQIATSAELAPGTIYLYFPGKEALYVELLMEGYEILHRRLSAEAGRPVPAAEQAARLLDVFLVFARENPEYFEIIFFLLQKERSGGWEGNFPADAVARVRAHEASCKAIASEILERVGFSDAEHRATTVEAVWSMLSGVIFHFHNDLAGEAVAARAKEMILAAIFSLRPQRRDGVGAEGVPENVDSPGRLL